MANHKSARKRVLRNNKRNGINTARVSRLRNYMKRIEQAIQSGSPKDAEAALRQAQPELYRSVAKGLIRKGTVARQMSRLNAKIKNLKKAS
ncbi:MAG: 30S ribosomal protein S20 [Alphaproteobacteria bacterium]